MTGRRRAVLGAACAVVVAAVLVAFSGPLLRAAVAGIAGVALGDRVAFDAFSLSANGATATGVRVVRGRELLFASRQLDVGFSLRDLLPGSTHRYGIRSIRMIAPLLRLVRGPDGRFDAFGAGPAGPPAPGGAAAVQAPLVMTVDVTGGRLEIVDRSRVLPASRELSLDGIAVRASLDTGAVSRYRASAYVDGDPSVTLHVAGTVDEGGAYAVHRVTASRVPIARLVNYFINTSAAQVLAGNALDLDVRAYAFGTPAQRTYHLAGGAQVDGGAMRVPGIVPDATAMHGRIDLYDGGIATRRLDAALGGIPVRLAGGLFGWGAPAFRLGIAAQTPFPTLRRLFRFSARLPVTGDRVRVATLLEGPVGSPLVASHVSASRAAYGAFPIRDASGLVVYDAGAVDLAGVRGRYGSIDASVDGDLHLGSRVVPLLAVRAAAPPDAVPYAAQAAPGVPLRAAAILTGVDVRIDARGVVAGAAAGTSVGGLFRIDRFGDGEFGPVHVERDDGSDAVGAYYADRAASRSGFWLSARGMPARLQPGRPVLPGLPGLVPPDFSAVVDADLAGAGPPSAFRIAGSLHARDLRLGTVVVDDARADVAGAFGNLRLGRLTARGAWGGFAGDGAYAGGRLALAGDYAGSFEALRSLTGDLHAAGRVDGPVALTIEPGRTVVQARGDRTEGAAVRAVPVDGLEGTLAVTTGRVDVGAATVRVAGGALAAAGSLAPGGRLGVSLAGADARRLRAAGSPLERGSLDAIGSAGNDRGVLAFDGGLALANGRYDGYALAGNGDVRVRGSEVGVARTDALVDHGSGVLAGSLHGVGAGTPALDLGLRFAGVDATPFARRFVAGRHDLAGTLDGNVRIGGHGASPAVAGHVRARDGRVNGLPVALAAGDVVLAPGTAIVRRGSFDVGSTRGTFAVGVRGADGGVRFRVEHADLADFDDFFDPGDALAGTGSVAADLVRRRGSVSTAADIDVAGLRFLRFALGDTAAHWTTRAGAATGSASLGGPSGRLAVAGTLRFPPGVALRDLARRASFDGTAGLQGLDLAAWLPAVGYPLPVTGTVDGSARIDGPLVRPTLALDALLAHGSIAKVPVERLALSATAQAGRVRIASADVALSGLSAVAAGTFGLAPRDPVAIAIHVTSPDVGASANRLLGATYPLSGRGEADVRIAGTRGLPTVSGSFDVEAASVKGVAVTRALGQFSLRGRSVELSNAEIDFPKGDLGVAGSLPFQLAPFGFGPPGAALAVDLTAQALDLGGFRSLLPAGSQLAGFVDGHVHLGGTVDGPDLVGALALRNGTVASPLETVPLTNVSGRLAFAGNGATLDALHAEAGGGRLDAHGTMRFTGIARAATAVDYRFDASAHALRLDFPAYGRGQVDGTLALSKEARMPPLVSGRLAFSDATIPFSALLFAAQTQPSGADPTSSSVKRNVGFDLTVSAERNVRIRSSVVDIGARGALQIKGTLADPELSGEFDSTGGTLTYFNTVFRFENGSVAFDPAAGILPTLAARATSHVFDPDPNVTRNVSGSADITLTLSGPVTNLNIQLASDPPYDRQQILGLLLNAPAIGATNLFDTTTPGAQTLAPGETIVRSGATVSVAQEAFGIVNAQFTRALLAPVESTVGEALGLSTLAVNVDYTGNVGVTARKVLGRRINAVYGQSFAYPYRQTFGFDVRPNDVTAAQFTYFHTFGAQVFGFDTPQAALGTTNFRITSSQPLSGQQGFSFSLQRLF